MSRSDSMNSLSSVDSSRAGTGRTLDRLTTISNYQDFLKDETDYARFVTTLQGKTRIYPLKSYHMSPRHILEDSKNCLISL